MPLRHIPAEGWGEKASPGRIQQKKKPLGCAGVELFLSRHVFSITYLQLSHFPVEKQICGPMARKFLPPSAHRAQVWEGADPNPPSGIIAADFFMNTLFKLGTWSLHHHPITKTWASSGRTEVMCLMYPKAANAGKFVFQNSKSPTLEKVSWLKTLKILNSDLKINCSSHLLNRPSHK